MGGCPAVSVAHIWDASSLASLDAITQKYASKRTAVTLVGMNDHNAQRHARTHQ